jgi:hypothetical protein
MQVSHGSYRLWRWLARAAGRAALAALLLGSGLVLPGCPGPSTPDPPPPPPQPQRRLVTQGTFTGVRNIAAFREAWQVNFTTGATGTLEVTADWTFSQSDIDLSVYRSPCTLTQAINSQCSLVTESTSTAKPERLSVTNLAAGSYVLFIYNVSLTTESGTYQIFLTS